MIVSGKLYEPPGPARVLITPDNEALKFANVSADRAFSQVDASSEVNMTTRRPLNSIKLKENTYAVISVVGPTGTPITIETGSSRKTEDYVDFILQGVEEARSEKQQLVETFGEPYVFFYGEQPRVVNIRGLFINSQDFNQRSQFWNNYENYFRGTKLVQNNARIYLAFDTIVVEGYPLAAQVQDSADIPNQNPFSMTILVTNYFDYSVGFRVETGLVAEREYVPTPGDPSVSSSASVAQLNSNIQASKAYNINNFRGYLNGYFDDLKGQLGIGQTWYKHFLGQWGDTWLDSVKKGWQAVHSIIVNGGGLIGDIADEVEASNSQFSMMTSAVYAPAASVLSALSDPEFSISFYTGGASASADYMIKEVKKAYIGKPESAMRLALQYTATATLMGAAVNPATFLAQAKYASGAGGHSTVDIGTRSSSLTSNETAVSGFIGSRSEASFDSEVRSLTSQIDAGGSVTPVIGATYTTRVYRESPGSASRYEGVYQDREFDQAISRDATLEPTLGEIYGDVESNTGVAPRQFEEQSDPVSPVISDPAMRYSGALLSPSVVEQTYKSGISPKRRYWLTELAKRLRESGIPLPEPVDTRGVRGVQDNDAEIEPIA